MQKKSILVVVTILLVANGTSRADVTTQSGSWDLSESLSIMEPINYSRSEIDSVPFLLFDPALGQLTGVEYSRISGVANVRVYARNISQQEGYFDFRYNVVGYASRTPLSGETLWFSMSGGFGGGSPFPDPLQDWTLVGGGGIDSEGSFTQYYSGSELDQFIGVGTFDLAPRIDVSFRVSNISPNIEAIFEANYAYAYEISYVYEPAEVIPAPGDILLGSIDIKPDILNLKSKGKWITCYIELPKEYDVDNVDVSTMILNEQVPAELKFSEIGDYDGDETPDLMVKFNRSLVQQILNAGDEVKITVSGELNDGTPFEGSDTIRVIDKGGKK